VYVDNTGNLTLLASATTGSSSTFQVSTTGTLTVKGAVDSPGSSAIVSLTGQNNLILAANVSGSNVTLTATTT